jgi:glycolate oxidase FAD binding subunit
MSSIADELARLAPDALLLSGQDLAGYAVGGVLPRAVIRPGTAEQAAAVLALAHERGWSVAPRGGGTLLDLGNPLARLDVVLDTGALDAVLDYQPDDMTVTAQAGVTLAALAALLAERGQVLPLNAPLPERATVGGTIAANIAGPLRLRFGTARDAVIGMQFATPAGGLARSGGRVVKNVAGYDLGKLHVGGLGTAGVITEATFKLQPTPAARAGVVATFATLDAASAAARAILHSQLFPAALDLFNGQAALGIMPSQSPASAGAGGWQLAALALGVPAAVERAARDIIAQCAAAGASDASEPAAPAREQLFSELRDYGRAEATRAELILRAAVLPSEIGRAVLILEEAGLRLGAAPALIARPFAGIALGFWREPELANYADAVTEARQLLGRFGGTLVVERAPLSFSSDVDCWGVDGADLALMRRLKESYDPAHVLNPGRFAGSI